MELRLKDFAKNKQYISGSSEYVYLLFISWISWGSTIGMSLIAFFLTIKSFALTIQQIDQNPNDVYEQPFNTWDKAVNIINHLSLAGFLLGLFFIGMFVYLNI